MSPHTGSTPELQAVLDASVDGVVIISARGIIERFNRSAERMFGYAAAEVVGRNVSLLMTSADGPRHDDYLERYLRTGVPHIIGIGREVDACRRDGSIFPVFLSVGRIAGAEPARFVGFLQDISAKRRAEHDAREARERLMHVSRLATMGEMATGISHELNQPLAAITSFADAARRFLDQGAGGSADVREALEQISGQALRAGEIIRRLRDLVRNRETRHEPAHINEVLGELHLLARADARASDVRIVLQPAAGLPPVRIDRIQIQQVLLNLVRNAIEALQEQPAARREIRITTAPCETGEIEIRVVDQGPGVAPDMQQRLFTPFATNKANGTGLGLAISRTIVESHQGTLTHRPEQPHGACFIIRLPINEEKT